MPEPVAPRRGATDDDRVAALSTGSSLDADTRLPAYEVVHAIPGRLRLRVPRVGSEPGYARAISGSLGSVAELTGVRVNRAAASIVVRYRPGTSLGAVRARLDQELVSTEPAAVSKPPAGPGGPPSGGGWRRIALPVLTAGLAILGGPLRLALPAPLIAATVAAASLPIARRAAHSLRVERRLNIDVLDLTAITLTTLRGSFLAPAAMITLVEVGDAIRERTARASQREALDLLDSMAQFVWLERAGGRERIPIDEVRRGQTVVVYPGDRIPVDGRVLDGRGLLDEHQLTGESMPVLREEGQTVYASTLMREGHLHIDVEQVGEETRAGRLVRLMQQAPVHDTRVENHAAKLADRAVLPSVLLSGALFVLTRDPARAASILIADFMTGVRVSVPTAVLAALTGAARRGILIRSGRALEQLAAVDAIVFDKTGTITKGKPRITGVDPVSDAMPAADVLTLAATAEQRLSHPVAEAVTRFAHEHGAQPGRRRGWHYEIGLGVRANVEGCSVLVGSDRLLRREGVALEGVPPGAGGSERSRVYVASDGELRGVMSYTDPLREESAGVVAALSRTSGLEVHLLTGDEHATARAVGETLGIDPSNTHAELFPEQKAAVVRGLRAAGKTVAFVGDGVNDLPALAYADVSVSFGGATEVARETADIVLIDDDLRGLPEALAIARQTLRVVRQNIGIVAGANLAAVGLAATGALGPVSAAVIHNGSTILSGANGLRALRYRARPPMAALGSTTNQTREPDDDEEARR